MSCSSVAAGVPIAMPSMPAMGEAVIAVSQLYVMVGVASWAATPGGVKKGIRTKAGMIAAVAALLSEVHKGFLSTVRPRQWNAARTAGSPAAEPSDSGSRGLNPIHLEEGAERVRRPARLLPQGGSGMRGCYCRVIHDARNSREPEISVVEAIVTARNCRLSNVAVVGMLRRRFMGLRRVRVTSGSMRTRSVMRRADLR